MKLDTTNISHEKGGESKVKQVRLFKFVCKCGRSLEVAGTHTEILCTCKRPMLRSDTLHPMTIYRYTHQLGQKALAQLLNVDRTVISKIEANNFVISAKLRDKITSVMGLDFSHILFS